MEEDNHRVPISRNPRDSVFEEGIRRRDSIHLVAGLDELKPESHLQEFYYVSNRICLTIIRFPGFMHLLVNQLSYDLLILAFANYYSYC